MVDRRPLRNSVRGGKADHAKQGPAEWCPIEMKPTPDRPIGLAHFSAISLPPLALVEQAARAGFAAVGLRLVPAFPGAPFYAVPAGSSDSSALRRSLSENGIAVYDIEFATIGPDFVPEALDPVLADAAELGARRLSLCGDDPDLARLADRLSALAERARPYGIGLDLEIMPWRAVGNLEAALNVAQAAATDGLGILIDALHLSRSGGEPADLSGLPRSLLRSLQLCDAVAQRPDTTDMLIAEARGGRLAPGAGVLPLSSLLSAMPEDAAISVEVPIGNQEPSDHIGTLMAATRRVLEGAPAVGG